MAGGGAASPAIHGTIANYLAGIHKEHGHFIELYAAQNHSYVISYLTPCLPIKQTNALY